MNTICVDNINVILKESDIGSILQLSMTCKRFNILCKDIIVKIKLYLKYYFVDLAVELLSQPYQDIRFQDFILSQYITTIISSKAELFRNDLYLLDKIHAYSQFYSRFDYAYHFKRFTSEILKHIWINYNFINTSQDIYQNAFQLLIDSKIREYYYHK